MGRLRLHLEQGRAAVRRLPINWSAAIGGAFIGSGLVQLVVGSVAIGSALLLIGLLLIVVVVVQLRNVR